VDTYQNPVYGRMPDPMALRGPGGYFVYGTGDLFRVAYSPDLVHWTPIGTGMTRRPDWVPQSGGWNPWAPSVIRREQGARADYVMYYSGLRTSPAPAANCIGIATSPRPGGPYADAGILSVDPPAAGRPCGCGDALGYSTIDPAPFVDPATGEAYLYVSTGHDASGAWHRTISVIGLAGDLVHAAGERRPLFSASEPWERDVVEGPWMVRHGDAYYLFYSGASFTDATYAMGYALGPSPTGPFTKPMPGPILASTPDVIGPGGGSVVTGPDGGDWLVYHACATPDAGRTLRIDPLVWDDDADPPTVTVRGPTTSRSAAPARGRRSAPAP
jgi:beta-xylosidase